MPTPVKRVVRKPTVKKAVVKKPAVPKKPAAKKVTTASKPLVKKVTVARKPAAPRATKKLPTPTPSRPIDEQAAVVDVPVAPQTVVAQPVFYRMPGGTHHLCIYQSDVAPIAVRVAMHHRLVIDRSGSMWGELKKVIEDVIDRITLIPDGDRVSIGWFSSEGGEFGWIVNDVVMEDGKRELLAKELRNYNYTVGCTCFSEILEDTWRKLEADKSEALNTFVFFTDGYPVVRDTVKEMDKVKAILGHMGEQIHAAMFVGYGRYYQRENLFAMASATNGIMVASDDVANFRSYLGDFWTRTTQSVPRVPVKLAPLTGKDPRGLIFGVVEGIPTQYFPDDMDKIYLLPMGYTSTVQAFELRPGPAPDVDRTALADDTLVYAAAYLLSQSGQSDLAITLLGGLGDVAAIKRLYNAFTAEEFAAAEKYIAQATKEPVLRYAEGVDRNYVPRPDAFCVVDALDILLADNGLCLDTGHAAWHYSRIGVKSEAKDDVTTKWLNGSGICKVTSSVWNQDFLNLSLSVVEPGSVQFDAANAAQAKSLGLTVPYPATRFRTYTLVKDGSLNMAILPVRISYETFQALYTRGLIDDDQHAADKTILVHIGRLPVMNRTMAKTLPTLAQVASLKMIELNAMAKLRVLKYKRAQLDPEKEVVTGATNLTPEQIAFLKANHVSASGAYSPPSTKSEPVDFYDAKTFVIDAVGLTSLSNTKLDDVEKRIKDGKAQTTPGKLLAEALNWYDVFAPTEGGRLVTLAWIDVAAQEIAKERDIARQNIQRTKFAVVLGKSWFSDAPSRDSGKVMLDGVEINVKLSSTRVPY